MTDGGKIPAVWSDRLCELIREIADEVVREKAVLSRCRELAGSGVRIPGVSIALEGDCAVVRVDGHEVAREFLEYDKDDWFFEDGEWVNAIEEFSETLPMAA